MEESKMSAVFGSRLRNLRESLNLRQDDIASLFEMNKSAVSQWENGRLPHPTIIAKIADYFHVSTDYLLGRIETINNSGYRTTFDGIHWVTKRESSEIVALSRADDPDSDLPEEALKQLEEYKELLRLKYKIKKPD